MNNNPDRRFLLGDKVVFSSEDPREWKAAEIPSIFSIRTIQLPDNSPRTILRTERNGVWGTIEYQGKEYWVCHLYCNLVKGQGE